MLGLLFGWLLGCLVAWLLLVVLLLLLPHHVVIVINVDDNDDDDNVVLLVIAVCKLTYSHLLSSAVLQICPPLHQHIL